MQAAPRRILITGTSGLVGNLLYRHLAPQVEKFTLFALDRSSQPSERIQAKDVFPIPAERFTQADLVDFTRLRQAVQGMDVVVHLAADPDGLSWESVRDNNMIGTYNLFEACRQAGVRRIVYASSLMVNFGYPAQTLYGDILHGDSASLPDPIPLIQHTDPTRPSGIYAASKVWGEALAYVYSFQHRLSCLCVRLGWVVGENRPRPQHCGGDWLSFTDCTRFLQACIEAPEGVRYDVFYAISDNRYRFVDLEHARQVLGYLPQEGDLHPFPPESV